MNLVYLPCERFTQSAVEIGGEQAWRLGERLHVSHESTVGESRPHAFIHVEPLSEAANLTNTHLMSIACNAYVTERVLLIRTTAHWSQCILYRLFLFCPVK
jgi:hypothetical protein